MMLDFTVAIPTYNGASRLAAVLERLRSQVIPAELSWEILVVDNNSSDDTATVVKDYIEGGKINVPLRYCFED